MWIVFDGRHGVAAFKSYRPAHAYYKRRAAWSPRGRVLLVKYKCPEVIVRLGATEARP